MAAYQRLDPMLAQSLEDDQQKAPNVQSTNKAVVMAQQIRAQKFSFREFYSNKEVSKDAYKFGDTLIGENIRLEERVFLVKKSPALCVELFTAILKDFRTKETLQIILTMLVDITESNEVTTLLLRHHEGSQITQLLLNILGRQGRYNGAQACLVIARFEAVSREVLTGDQLNQYLSWTISHLRHNNEFAENISKAVMSFLKNPAYRKPFYEANGIKPILDMLDHKINFQLQYELIVSLWMITFDSDLVYRLKDDNVLVAVLCDVLKTTNRPKVQRVIMATFRNLVEKSDDAVADDFAARMIHFKAFPVINLLVSKSLDDDDFKDDAQVLYDKLKLSLQDLSSFDEYAAEVRSGRLEWSPVHRSDKFWRENVMLLNEKNYEMLRLLVANLKESQSSTVLAVAAHDLGEYVRYYPRGKRVIDSLGAKELVMNLVEHHSTEVRMQALLSIQKMMVQNWEYLGKQLENKA